MLVRSRCSAKPVAALVKTQLASVETSPVRLAVRTPSRLVPPVLVLLMAVVVSMLPASGASADSVGQAEAAAQQVAAQIQRLEPRLQDALHAYETAVKQLGASVTTGLQQSQNAAALQSAADAAQTTQTQHIQQLYMSGGSLQIWATIFDSTSPADFMERVNSVNHVIANDAFDAQRTSALAAQAQSQANGAMARTTVFAETAGSVQADLNRLQGLMAAAQAQLATLSARARSLRAAQQAALALAQAEAAAAAAGSSAASTAHGNAIPPTYLVLFKAAALTCPGMDWHLLAAIGQVESHDGQNMGPSSAGAEGPMQFMPATFAHYAVDGNHDGILDIWSPADAIFSAANDMCQNGAGSPGGLHGAIFNYNHAEWYVQMVLRIMADLQVKYP
jgi:hypothetical protein